MVGETVIVGSSSYLVVNTTGTLERLPAMGPWAILWLWFITRGGNMPIAWIREYAKRHAKIVRAKSPARCRIRHLLARKCKGDR